MSHIANLGLVRPCCAPHHAVLLRVFASHLFQPSLTGHSTSHLCMLQIGTKVHQAVASASGQSLDGGAEEAKRKLPRNRPSAVANFILDQFLPLGLLLAMVVGCACKHAKSAEVPFSTDIGCTLVHGTRAITGAVSEGRLSPRNPPLGKPLICSCFWVLVFWVSLVLGWMAVGRQNLMGSARGASQVRCTLPRRGVRE